MVDSGVRWWLTDHGIFGDTASWWCLVLDDGRR